MAEGIEEAKGPAVATDHEEAIMQEKVQNEQARIATEAEHNISAWKAFRMYKKATLWSICAQFPILFIYLYCVAIC